MNKYYRTLLLIFFSCVHAVPVSAAYHFANFTAHPPIHAFGSASATPKGLTPERIKRAYNLPKSGGSGTIVLIGAYQDPTIEHDLGVFSDAFTLPPCTIKNGCLTVHPMTSDLSVNSGWSMETSLDVEWAHAIAPNAKIILVEAKTASGPNLLAAVDYAVSQQGVVAVSMSWGGKEFADEVGLDSHFSTHKNITFFASAGDNGTGASWPAASPYVVAVGGTHLTFSGNVISETAWTGSGGGVSAYEKEPSFQLQYVIPKALGMRAIPDVAYDADPASGVSVYYSGNSSAHGWYVFGGTSAGAPQWAAIKSLGGSADNSKFYDDKSSSNPVAYFRDIRNGQNGDCGYVCTARAHYDYITGLGSPLTVVF